MNRGSIGPFEYDAFISYATSPSLDAGDEDDPEERFVRNLIEGLEGGSGGERNSSIRYTYTYSTGPQQKFNPKKLCRTKYHFPLVQTCLENMPDVVFT